jgi:hypothetical protein
MNNDAVQKQRRVFLPALNRNPVGQAAISDAGSITAGANPDHPINPVAGYIIRLD